MGKEVFPVTVPEFASGKNFWEQLNVLQPCDKKTWAEKVSEKQMKIVCDSNTGLTVAHVLAAEKVFPEKYAASRTILSLADAEGWTVAHVLAELRYFPAAFLEDPDILLLANKNRLTVLHELAEQGDLPRRILGSKEMLGIQTIHGITVAGYAVRHIIDGNDWEQLSPELLGKEYTFPSRSLFGGSEKMSCLGAVLKALDSVSSPDMDYLTGNSAGKILSRIPAESLAILYAETSSPALSEKISLELDIRATGIAVDEIAEGKTPGDSEDREILYCTERNR